MDLNKYSNNYFIGVNNNVSEMSDKTRNKQRITIHIHYIILTNRFIWKLFLQ